jgi:uncharacterized protein YkwD
MAKNQYVSHTSPLGTTLRQRLADAGIKYLLSENVASNGNLTDIHLTLKRSPAHLRTIASKEWTKLGIGIAQDNQNVFYVA